MTPIATPSIAALPMISSEGIERTDYAGEIAQAIQYSFCERGLTSKTRLCVPRTTRVTVGLRRA